MIKYIFLLIIFFFFKNSFASHHIFSGASIPAGCGTLTNLTIDGEATGLSGIIISNSVGGNLEFDYYVESNDIEGCTDQEACNYNSEATLDDNSCEYAQENFDCDGNCLIEQDCLGVCGGNAEIGCDNICDSGLVLDEDSGPQVDPLIKCNQLGEAYVIWNDRKEGSSIIVELQKVTIDGGASFMNNGQEVWYGVDGNALLSSSLYIEDGQHLVAWEDNRYLSTGHPGSYTYGLSVNDSPTFLSILIIGLKQPITPKPQH